MIYTLSFIECPEGKCLKLFKKDFKNNQYVIYIIKSRAKRLKRIIPKL